MDAAAIAAACAASVQPVAAHRGIRMRVDADDPRLIDTDEHGLRHVLLNLLNNAIKFTAEGEVCLAVKSSAGTVRFSVSDTGIGIADDDLERIFEPFTQVDSGLTRRYGGAGIGLSLCRSLATALGGTITVRSVLGEGSTFVLQLPVTSPSS